MRIHNTEIKITILPEYSGKVTYIRKSKQYNILCKKKPDLILIIYDMTNFEAPILITMCVSSMVQNMKELQINSGNRYMTKS